MPSRPNVIYLQSNSSLTRFNLPLMTYLSGHAAIAAWEYQQDDDRGSSLELVLESLDDYLQSFANPVHLIGHSTSALIGLRYANLYPNKVLSLTALGLGVNAGVDWISHYYTLRETLPCSRRVIISRLVKNLFGPHDGYQHQRLVNCLEQSLERGFSPHSLYQRSYFPATSLPQPLMICGSQNDPIITPEQLRGWQNYLKSEDYYWECADGFHFFHFFYPSIVGKEILSFWGNISSLKPSSVSWPG